MKKGSFYKEYARGGRGEKKVITLYLMEGTTYNGKIGQNGSPQAYSGTSNGVTKGGNGSSATFFTESVAGGPGGQASGDLVLTMMGNILIIIIITIILTAKTYLLMDNQVGTMIQMEPIIKQEPIRKSANQY